MEIERHLKAYLDKREPRARYTSFDYCFNYFQSHREQGKLVDLLEGDALQLSCLHLGFYLASWGMLRGSSELLKRSVRTFAHMGSFADAERGILLDALLPTAPSSPIESNRLMSYTAFLARAAKGQVPREYRAILATAINTRRELAKVLEDVLHGWVLYLVRDSLAVAHEITLKLRDRRREESVAR